MPLRGMLVTPLHEQALCVPLGPLPEYLRLQCRIGEDNEGDDKGNLTSIEKRATEGTPAAARASSVPLWPASAVAMVPEATELVSCLYSR